MYKFAFALAAAVVATSPVLAQSAGPAAGSEPFNGAYVGVQGGWQQDRQKLTVTDANGTRSASQNKSGFAYGGQIGYDFKLTPQVVLGVEASLTGRTGESFLDDGNGGTARLKQGRTIGASARLGYLVSPEGLLYVRGGYANAKFNIDDAFGRVSEKRDGYVAGVGYEQIVARNVSARIEYDYSHFGTDNLPALATGLGANTADLKYTRNAVTAGLNFRF